LISSLGLVAAAVLAATLFLFARAALGSRDTLRLAAVAPLSAEECPGVVVVVAARDEAHGIERGLRSLLAQDLAKLRVVAVDDRSTDGTSDILRRVAAEDPRLEVVRVESLPAGWLGKNHALARGASGRTEEWILFTDADVVLEPTTLRRACRAVTERELDHLTAGPQVEAPSAGIAIFVGAFTTLFGLWLTPWRAARPDREEAMGIGAFNLVRRAAYEAVGGYAAIRNRPDDDLRLGRAIKGSGFRQELASGRGLVRVEWYRSLAEAARGLEKNAFAGLDYSAMRAAAAVGLLLLLHAGPFVALPFVAGWPGWLFAATAATQIGGALGASRETGVPAWTALFFPVGVVLLAAVVVRSVALALLRGGVAWRGTFYPLEELRRPVDPGD